MPRIVNAVSGECTDYSKDDLPEWIDHAYSLDYLMELASDNYKYKGGFWNSLFKQEMMNPVLVLYLQMQGQEK